jgi:hypothetical protein
MNVHFALLLAATLCFLIAAAGTGLGRVNLVALGLALWMLTLLVPR